MNATTTKKRTTEAATIVFTLSSETLNGAFPTAGTVTGSPSGLTIGTVGVLEDGVVCDITGGTDGTEYSLTASITLSDGRTVVELQQLYVTNPALVADFTLHLEEPDYVFTNLASAVGLIGEYGTRLRLDDDQSRIAGPGERRFLLNYAKVATAIVRRKCNAYDVEQLIRSWSVWHWATVIFARWLALRRCNPFPPGLQEAYLETMDELTMIKLGQEYIEDINLAIDPAPSWSNTRIDHFYTQRQQRVQKATSDTTRSVKRRHYDTSSFLTEPDW